MFIEDKDVQGMRVLIKMSDISSVWEVKREYPDFKTKYKVNLSNGVTFTFDEETGQKIYEAYKEYLRGE